MEIFKSRILRKHSTRCRYKKGEPCWAVIDDSYRRLKVGSGYSSFVVFRCNDPDCEGLLAVRLDEITSRLPRK